MIAARLLAVAALTSAVHGFSNTSPVLVWSSTGSSTLDSLPSRLDGTIHSQSLLESLLETTDICNHEAIIIIEQPGLHASDLRSLSPRSDIATRLQSCPSARHYPYVPHHPDFNISSFARIVSTACRSHLSQLTLGDSSISLDHEKKHVFHIAMPSLVEMGKNRKDTVSKHEKFLSTSLTSLSTIFSNHLVVFAGSPLAPSSFSKRETLNNLKRLPFTVYSNTTLPEGGILKKYQLFTAELLSSLLISLFVILPVVFFGVMALASIQNPIRMDISRSSFNAQEKKNQ